MCPALTGGNNYFPPSYSRRTGLVYIPAYTMCNDMTLDQESIKKGIYFARPMKFTERNESDMVMADPLTGEVKKRAHSIYVDEWIGDGRLGRKERPPVAGGFPGAHHRAPHFAHDGADVGEVEIDEAFLHYQVGDAGDAGIEHLIGHREGVGEGRLLVGDPEQGSE